MGGVYLIRCKPTGEIYVGGTVNSFATRFTYHRRDLAKRTGKNPLLQERYNHYGPDAFEYVPLREFLSREVRTREIEAIRRLQPALNTMTYKTPPAVSPQLRLYRERRGLDLQKPPNSVRGRCFEVRGEMLTPDEIAAKYGVDRDLVVQRAYRGVVGEKLIKQRYVR